MGRHTAWLLFLVSVGLLAARFSHAKTTSENLSYLKKRAPALRENIFNFWLNHGEDKDFGAFHGTLDRQGKPIEPTYKGLFQTGRHLWAMSYYYGEYPKNPKVSKLAYSLYQFLKENFYKGGRLYFKVARNGTELEEWTGYQTQGNWFGILGLATFAKVFKHKEASQLVLNLYKEWRAAAWDEKYGGFNEAKDNPNWNSEGVVKSINVQTHGAEMLAAVYEATKSVQAAKDLAWLTELCATKVIGNNGRVSMGFKADWTPVEPKPASIDFSAELQTWMLLDIVEHHPKLFKPDVLKTITNRVLGALRHAVKYSYDDATGSFCMKGPADESCVGKDPLRTWYAQTEGVLGLYKLWKYSKDKKQAAGYLSQLSQSVQWVSDKQSDSTYGEMYYTVDLQGKPAGDTKDYKGTEWKASYHSGRMAMFLEGWLKKN